MWYELLAEAPESIQTTLEQAQLEADTLVCGIYAMVALACSAIAGGAWRAAADTADAKLWITAVISVVLALILYRRLLNSVEGWGSLVRALVNSTRDVLREKHGLRTPSSPEDEKRMWQALTASHVYGPDAKQEDELARYKRPIPDSESAGRPSAGELQKTQTGPGPARRGRHAPLTLLAQHAVPPATRNPRTAQTRCPHKIHVEHAARHWWSLPNPPVERIARRLTGCVAMRFTEPDCTAPASTDSSQRRFSTHFSTQRGSAAKLKSRTTWSQPPVGVAGQSVPAAFQAGYSGSISVARSNCSRPFPGTRAAGAVLFSDVGLDDAPTRVVCGSHLYVPEFLASFGETGTNADAVFWQPSVLCRPVAHATGRAGDVFLCHPFLIHRYLAAPGHGAADDRLACRPCPGGVRDRRV
jgi:hypothetical protein